MVGLLVQKKRGIAEHAHVLNAAQDALLIDLGQPALFFPLAQEHGKDIALLVILLCLFRGQRNTKDLIGPLRELLENLRAGAPKQDWRHYVVNTIRAPVSEQMA